MDVLMRTEFIDHGPQESALSRFMEAHKGDVALAVSALVYATSWAILRFTPFKTYAEMGVSVAEAALIGGLCDYIALKMIFEKRWYLPMSGVLPRNRDKLINGLASTIENQWLTPQMIGNKLHEMDLVARLGSMMSEVNVRELMSQPGVDRLLSRIANYLDSPDVVERLEGFLRKILPNTFRRLYSVLNRIGVKSLSSQVAANLRKRIPELRRDPEVAAVLQSAIRELGQQLHDPESPAHELATRAVETMVNRAVESSRGEIAKIVRENLNKLDTEKIKVQIESRTRTHLDWIRVNGGIFGAFFGLMFALSRIAARHGTALIAMLHFMR